MIVYLVFFPTAPENVEQLECTPLYETEDLPSSIEKIYTNHLYKNKSSFLYETPRI